MILRPGIVYGPRLSGSPDSRAVVEGSASVVADGRGVCNAIYVDNLVHAVDLALEREEAADEAFLVADDDPVTWRMLYEPVCRALGHSWDAVADLLPRSSRRTPAERLLELKEDPAARRPRPGSAGGAQPDSTPGRPSACRAFAGPAKADARDVDPADLRLQVPDHKGAPHARLRAAGRVRRGVPQDRRLARLRRLSGRRCGTEAAR